MINLLPHQQASYDKLIKQGYIYLAAPTGWGKSFFAMKAMEEVKTGTVVLAPSHLFKQWKKYFEENNIEYVKNEMSPNKVSWWSVQKITRDFKDKTFKNLFMGFLNKKLLIIDEYHRILGMTSNIYRALQNNKAGAYIFLSATPFERGVWDIYPALRINSRLDIRKNWGDTWRSVTSFKQNHCVMGGFEDRIIQRVFEGSKQMMLNEVTVVKHAAGEGDLVNTHQIVVDADNADKLIRDYRKNDEYHYATARTMLNGFKYVDHSMDLLSDEEIVSSEEIVEKYQHTFDSGLPMTNEQIDYLNLMKENLAYHWRAERFFGKKETVHLFKSHKPLELRKIINNMEGKGLVFYEFTAEKDQMKDIEGLVFYDKKKFDVDDFEASEYKVMACHYRSLGEGVRVKFADNIIMFTVSVSNRMKTQAIGRAIYASRKKRIDVFIFTTDTRFEKDIIKKLDKKEANTKELLTVKRR